MNTKITILNVLSFDKNGKKGVRIGFIYPDKKRTDSAKFKGFSDCEVYYSDLSIYDRIPVDCIGVPIDAVILQTVSESNPLKTYAKIGSIIYKDKEISLC